MLMSRPPRAAKGVRHGCGSLATLSLWGDPLHQRGIRVPLPMPFNVLAFGGLRGGPRRYGWIRLDTLVKGTRERSSE
eukprot:9275393-Pyramimonas_sp.AAC.1